jgi:DNA invertase Pin-like site-specific DNA recombinase
MVSDGFRRRPGRKAGIYVRQSSPDQVLHNKGSRAHQLAQREIAVELGYPDELIEVYEDAGLSGTAADHREDYQRMLGDIRKEELDLVIASEVGRLGRDANEWLSLLYCCGIHDVWLVVEGKMINPKQGDERFITGILAMAAEYDNWRRSQASMTARIAKLNRRQAVTPPPAGYVWGPEGTWEKDDRPGIRESIEAHYRALRERRSLRRAVALLRELGVESPRRLPRGAIGWSKPTVCTLRRFVHHPAYIGDATYGRQRGDPTRGRDRRGRLRTRRVPEGEVFVIRDHHEPYISRNEQQALKAMLERNAFTGQHGVLGPGPALAQGVLKCGRHRQWSMLPVSKEVASGVCVRFDYVCTGGVAEGKSRCGAIPGWVVDKPLQAAVVERLRPHALDELEAALEQAEGDARSEARRQRDACYRLRREIDDLELRLSRVDPKHWTVARRYEEQLHEKNLQLRRLDEQQVEVPAAKQFTEVSLGRLRVVCANVDGLLAAPTTEPHDRKELVRVMIDRVIVELRTRERVVLRIVWNDGAADTVREVLLFPYAHRMIQELSAQGVEPADIATELNAKGVVTKYQTPWTAQNVRRQRDRAHRIGGAEQQGQAMIKTRRGNPFTAVRAQQAMWRRSRRKRSTS